ILKTAGNQSLTVLDKANNSFTSNASATVIPAEASTFAFSGLPASGIAGDTESFTITAQDPFGNTVTGYSGTVHFTSSDPQAILPGDYTFITADAGSQTFSVTLKTAGTPSVSASDTQSPSMIGSQKFVITPGAATSLAFLTQPGNSQAGATLTA